MRAAVAGTRSTSHHDRSRIPGRLSPRPLNLFQPGWFQARWLSHRGQAWSRVWLQPLSGPNPPGELQWMDPPGGVGTLWHKDAD